jgi:hypothetical protein
VNRLFDQLVTLTNGVVARLEAEHIRPSDRVENAASYGTRTGGPRLAPRAARCACPIPSARPQIMRSGDERPRLATA